MRGRAFLLALVACGDGGTLPDATTGSDAAARGRVTVRVHKQFDSAHDRVIFQNADSTIVLVTQLNDAGEASALMAAGGFVSVFDGTLPNALYTWTGVRPGDELDLDLRFEQVGDQVPQASLRIAPLAGALDYFVFSRCESFTEVSPALDGPFAPFGQPCTTSTDLLLLARDSTAQPIGYRYTSQATVGAPGTIDMRGPYAPFRATAEVIGPPNTTVSILSKLAGVFYTIGTSALITDARVTVPLAMPDVADATMQTTARSLNLTPEEDALQPSEQTAVVWGPASATTTLDLASPRLRSLASRPALDLESYTIQWTEAPDGDPGDVVWVSIGLSGAQWIVIGARTDETFLRLPVVPYPGLRPDPETTFVGNFALVSTTGGYDRVRSYLLGHWNPSNGSWWPMVEPSGHVSFRSLL